MESNILPLMLVTLKVEQLSKAPFCVVELPSATTLLRLEQLIATQDRFQLDDRKQLCREHSGQKTSSQGIDAFTSSLHTNWLEGLLV